MSQFISNLPFYVLSSLFLGAVGWALFYGMPLALRHAMRAPIPASFAFGKALMFLVSGLAIFVALFSYLSAVPFGAMPCGPRFPCPAGADFVYLAQHPLQYLFKAGPLACILLFGALLIVIGGRSLLARDAA